MNATASDMLAHQMGVMKELYTEFFMLMLRSLDEEPGEPGTGVIDGTIEVLMGRIDEEMREFRKQTAMVRGERLLPETVDLEMREFEQNLRDSIQGMLRRIEVRRGELNEKLSDVKDRLRLVQRKRTGARGYQRGIAGGRVLDSQI